MKRNQQKSRMPLKPARSANPRRGHWPLAIEIMTNDGRFGIHWSIIDIKQIVDSSLIDVVEKQMFLNTAAFSYLLATWG